MGELVSAQCGGYHTLPILRGEIMKDNTQDRIIYLRWFILIHSYLYYHKDDSVVSDAFYDQRAHELVELQKQHGCKGELATVFKDFDGSTGFNLFKQCNIKQKQKIESLADALLWHRDHHYMKGAQ